MPCECCGAGQVLVVLRGPGPAVAARAVDHAFFLLTIRDHFGPTWWEPFSFVPLHPSHRLFVQVSGKGTQYMATSILIAPNLCQTTNKLFT